MSCLMSHANQATDRPRMRVPHRAVTCFYVSMFPCFHVSMFACIDVCFFVCCFLCYVTFIPRVVVDIVEGGCIVVKDERRVFEGVELRRVVPAEQPFWKRRHDRRPYPPSSAASTASAVIGREVDHV